jgi:hypothetical protein
MTNFDARTTSNIVHVEDAEAVKRLIGEYTFGDARPEITDEGLGIYGYSWFTAERDMCIDENEDELSEEEKTYESEDMTEEFLGRLAEIIPRDEMLEIHEIGGEGLRFPFVACRIRVKGYYGAEFETFF